MSKIPLADGLQADTPYSVLLPFRANVRSASEAACSVAASNVNIRRHLIFIKTPNGIFTFRSTAIHTLSAY
jgi:hypothetical protein